MGGDKGSFVQLAVCNKAFTCLPAHMLSPTIFNIFIREPEWDMFFFYVNNLLLCFVSFLWFYFAADCYYEQTKDSSPLQQSRLFGFFINNIWQPASTQHIQSCLVAGRFSDLFNIHCTVYSTGKVSPVLFVLKHRILPAGS